jgi:glutaredoxin 3
MIEVVIYTREFCGYCSRAVSLLTSKGAQFQEIPAGMDPEKRREMIERAGGRSTFPQIFIDGKHIGGSDELSDLDRAGKLDGLLNP